MAIRLPATFNITSSDEHLPCRFCNLSAVADPDDLERWAGHLLQWHGYAIAAVLGKTDTTPRTIQLSLTGWPTTRAKFAANQRIVVKPESHPTDYAGLPGIVIGWDPKTSQYAIAIDQYPFIGVEKLQSSLVASPSGRAGRYLRMFQADFIAA
jgi:hypothetical protein